jgi:hypothetical protein
MPLRSKIRGTIETIFSLGLGGPNLKNNGGVVENRNAADAAFVVARGADPVAANDFVTLEYLQNNAVANVWTTVVAGATQAITVGKMYAADSTGAVVTFNAPSAPVDGSVFFVKLIGASVLVPVKINAGAGDTIEDPQNPGTFSSVAGQVVISTAGAFAAWKYQTANTRWIEFA